MPHFEYSREAQAALPHFHNVEIEVFVEGSRGDDVSFWEGVFEKFCSKKVSVTQRGGKKELRAILDQKGGLSDNVYIALDRDLEDIIPDIGKRKNLIYTYGYSYENDLYSQQLIFDVIRHHAHLSEDSWGEVQKHIKNHMDTFSIEIAAYMCAFSKAFQKHLSVLPNPTKSSNFEAFFIEKSIKLNYDQIQKCINKLQEKCCISGKHLPFNNVRYCNGHLFETFVCHLVNYLCKNKRLLGKEELRELALRGFEKFLPSEVRTYYSSLLSKI